MIPQEKAKELFMRNFEITVDDYCAKQCALIAVDEIIDMLMTMNKYMLFPKQVQYWQEVKQEIEQL